MVILDAGSLGAPGARTAQETLCIDNEPPASVAALVPASFRRFLRVIFGLPSASQFPATPSMLACLLLSFIFSLLETRTPLSMLKFQTTKGLCRSIMSYEISSVDLKD